jgi:hypothetical protein
LPTDLLRLGPIKPGETQSRQIIWGISKIDYFCSIHPQEVGTVIILEKPEADLTNTERFRMLSNTFNIKPADSLAHIDSPERKAREAALNGLERPEALVKYFDPLTLEMVLNPQKHQLQSKCLTIAYWDISGFSDMCKQLIDRPSTIILLILFK